MIRNLIVAALLIGHAPYLPAAPLVVISVDGLDYRYIRYADPLGALKTSMADLDPHLDRLRAQIDGLEQTRASLTADLARAGTLLEGLIAANAVARDAVLAAVFGGCRRHAAGTEGPMHPDVADAELCQI